MRTKWVYLVEIEDSTTGTWYNLDPHTKDLLEAFERFQHVVAFGRRARLTSTLVSDVE
jgi:hypothetical protein